MYAVGGSYSAAIALSALSLAAAARLGVRSYRKPGDPRRLLGLIVAIATGVLVLFSTLDELGDQFFSAHMVEHELLLFTMPIALLSARPLPVLLIAPWRLLPSHWRRSVGWHWNWGRKSLTRLHSLARPALALALSSAVLWLWHVPTFYDLALQNEWVHTLEHISFLVTALLYWRPLLAGKHASPLNTNARRVTYLLAGSMQAGLLGGLIALNRSVLYTGYLENPAVSLHSALMDQQIGGAIMWFSGPVFAAAVAVLMLE